jgi:hypothetical protein
MDEVIKAAVAASLVVSVTASCDAATERKEDASAGYGDQKIMWYENRLRGNASPEKLFKYFASVVKNDIQYMTPGDFVCSITPLSANPRQSPVELMYT